MPRSEIAGSDGSSQLKIFFFFNFKSYSGDLDIIQYHIQAVLLTSPPPPHQGQTKTLQSKRKSWRKLEHETFSGLSATSSRSAGGAGAEQSI